MAARIATLFPIEANNSLPSQANEPNTPITPAAFVGEVILDNDDQVTQNKRHRDLAIGAPLTAAVTGSVLVFDNLASAVELPFENKEGNAALTETEQLNSLEADKKGGIGQTPEPLMKRAAQQRKPLLMGLTILRPLHRKVRPPQQL